MDLSQGFEKFVKHDDSIDERLDSLLKTIMHHEQQTGKKIDAQVVTWRGIITKVSGPVIFPLRVCRHIGLQQSGRLWPLHLRTAMGIAHFIFSQGSLPKYG